MPKAIITLEDGEEQGDVHIQVEFDPPFNGMTLVEDPMSIPESHWQAIQILNDLTSDGQMIPGSLGFNDG